MNTVNLIGRWTRDVELRYTQAGKAVASGSLAVNDGDRADFIPVVIWDRTAEAVANHHGRKGQQVGITGRLQSRTYTTQDGQKRTVIEVVASRVEFIGGPTQEQEPQPPMGTEVQPDEDDDVPF